MTKTSLIALIAMSIFPISSAHANQLDGSEIEQMIGGKKVYLATRWGIEFPLIYRTNGRVTGDGSGTGLGKFMAPKETGKWWIQGSQMCQQFPTWYDGRPLCFTLEQTGPNSLIWKREDGRSGTARVS